MARTFACGACFALITILAGCGDNDESNQPDSKPTQTASATPSGDGACGLLMQGEVDEIFGTSIGRGVSESLEDGAIALCSWPGNEPALLLQISDATPDIRAAADLGDGYRVTEITDLSGPAAVAIEEADGPETVVVIAMTTPKRTITISPVGLGLTEDTPQFTRLKELMDTIASRIE